MHPKISKLFRTLENIGFWQEGLGYQDIYGKQNKLTQEEKNEKLNKYIVQTDDRLYLFEWLLKKYQKDIFERYNESQVEKSHYGDNIERIQSIINPLISFHPFQGIKDILLNLGLFWTNKYTKGVDYLKVVEGISGTESSFHIMYVVAKFVEESLQPTKLKEEIEGFETLSELISNKENLVNQKLSLFPIDFPCRYELTYEEVQKEVQNLKEEYQERLNQFEELVLKYQEKCQGTDGQITYSSEATKVAYARGLNKFKEALLEFVEEYKMKKYKVKNMITRMESNKIVIPEELVELMDDVSKKHTGMVNLTKQLENADLDEKINVLELGLQKLVKK